MSETQAAYRSNDHGGHVESVTQQFIHELGNHYAQVPENLIASGKGNFVLVYAALDRIAASESDECFASDEELVKRTGLGIATVRRAKAWLRKEGWIEIVHQGRTGRATDYRLFWKTQRIKKEPSVNQNDWLQPIKVIAQPESLTRALQTEKENSETNVSSPKKEPTWGDEIPDTHGVGITSEQSSEAPEISPAPRENNHNPWPEWFALGYGVKGWTIDFATAEEWRVQSGFSEAFCLDKVYVVRSWWSKQKEKEGKNPYATFQRACRENWGNSTPRASASIQLPADTKHGHDAYEKQEAQRRAEAATEGEK